MERLTSADPSSIGAYRLLGRLGEGGMGRVYLARSDRGRTVAVKVVRSELAQHSDFRRRFAQEIDAARKVGGEWTAPVLDADTEADTPWVATGYVAGPALPEVVDESYGALPERSVWALASGLVGALEAIHGAGLVHRDLKPSNILVTIDGPRVIDFGIAHALHTVTGGGGLTRTGAVIGSPGFMAPEQVRGEPVTFASDVFCLGAVLAYAATGRMPFGTADSGVHALMYRIAQEDPDLSGLSGALYDLVSRCLLKDPAARPSVAELRQATEDVVDGAALSGAWLPAEVLAQLGRHAVQLLDTEDPESRTGQQPAVSTRSDTPPSAGTPPPQTTGSYGPSPYHSHQSYGTPGAYGPAWQPSTPAGPGGYPVTGPTPVVGPNPVLGPTPVAAPRTGPVAPLALRPPQPAGAVATWACVALGLTMLLALVQLLVSFAVYGELSASTEWEYSLMYNLEELRNATLGMNFLTLFLTTPAVVLWLVWFWRMRTNAESFAPGRVRHNAGMAIGAWFVPVGNLFLPKQIANDVWAASDPTRGGAWMGARPRTSGLLNTWWIFFLAMEIISLQSTSNPWYEANSLNAARFSAWLDIVGHLLVFPAAILAIVVVQRLSQLQRQRMGY